MPSPSPSSSASTASSSSARRVTFMDTDTIISVPSYIPSEADLETERPQPLSSAPPLLYSPNSTASTSSTSGPYTPPTNSGGDISIQNQGGVASDSDSLTSTLSDPVVLLETKAPHTCENHCLVLHTCLTTSSPVQWDMLVDPQTPPRLEALVQFGPDFMTHPGFPDSVSKIEINCDMLPWPIIIDIKQDGDRSPRIEDIFESIYVSLRKLASSVDYNNQTAERQRRIEKAYRRRCSQSSFDERRDGLRRIDFLEDQTIFLGLSPGNDDHEWHLHVGWEY